MNDTPETDANDQAWAYNMQYDTFSSLMDNPLPWDKFARKLERERDEAIRSCHIWQKGHAELVEERDRWISFYHAAIAERNEAREQRDELAKALEECREDSIELLGERSWWKDEPRSDYKKRYKDIENNIARADAALAAVNQPTNQPK